MDDFVMQKLTPKEWKPLDSGKWMTVKDIQGFDVLFSIEKFSEILYKNDGSERFIPP